MVISFFCSGSSQVFNYNYNCNYNYKYNCSNYRYNTIWDRFRYLISVLTQDISLGPMHASQRARNRDIKERARERERSSQRARKPESQ